MAESQAVMVAGKPAYLTTNDLTKLAERGAHILVPVKYATRVSPLWAGSYEAVTIDPNPDKKEVWKLPGGSKLGLSKVGLMKIARAAGIEMYDSQVLERSTGYIRYGALVRKRSADGLWEYHKGAKSLNREILLDEEVSQNTAKIGREYGPRTAEEARTKAEENVRRIWRFHEERAETGAYLRAIRNVLAIRGDYTAADLSKPFIVQAIQFAPDESRPDIQTMYRHAMEVMTLKAFESFGHDDPASRRQLEIETGKTFAELEGDEATYQNLLRGNAPEEGPPLLEEGVPSDEDELPIYDGLEDEDL